MFTLIFYAAMLYGIVVGICYLAKGIKYLIGDNHHPNYYYEDGDDDC